MIRECDCKEFQDYGHTEECDKHYFTARVSIKPPSDKQRAAQIRNDKIRRLRGIAATVRGMDIPQCAENRILMGVDEALESYGAASEREHRKKLNGSIDND
jgi:hypothetical protein